MNIPFIPALLIFILTSLILLNKYGFKKRSSESKPQEDELLGMALSLSERCNKLWRSGKAIAGTLHDEFAKELHAGLIELDEAIRLRIQDFNQMDKHRGQLNQIVWEQLDEDAKQWLEESARDQREKDNSALSELLDHFSLN